MDHSVDWEFIDAFSEYLVAPSGAYEDALSRDRSRDELLLALDRVNLLAPTVNQTLASPPAPPRKATLVEQVERARQQQLRKLPAKAPQQQKQQQQAPSQSPLRDPAVVQALLGLQQKKQKQLAVERATTIRQSYRIKESIRRTPGIYSPILRPDRST